MTDNDIGDLAQRYGVSVEAVSVLRRAIAAGGGRAAQFSHPDLGGMGQWSNGMIMIGDMFNNGLKDRVARLCSEIADMPVAAVPARDGDFGGSGSGGGWWPHALGNPSSTGSQNSMRYACFPDTRRLAIEQDGRLTIYDTGEHRLGGFSQAQSSSQTLVFQSQFGTVRADDLTIVKD